MGGNIVLQQHGAKLPVPVSAIFVCLRVSGLRAQSVCMKISQPLGTYFNNKE